MCNKYHPEKRENEDDIDDESSPMVKKSATQTKNSESTTPSTSTPSTSSATISTASRSNTSPKSNETSTKRETRRSAEKTPYKIIEVSEEPRKSSRRLGSHSQNAGTEKPTPSITMTEVKDSNQLDNKKIEPVKEKTTDLPFAINEANTSEDYHSSENEAEEDSNKPESIGLKSNTSSEQLQASLPDMACNESVGADLTPDACVDQKSCAGESCLPDKQLVSEKESNDLPKNDGPDKEAPTNGISSKIMKDVKGPKNLKSILFER